MDILSVRTMAKHKCVKLKSWISLMLLIFLELCSAYKILVVFPNPARSHGNLGDTLVQHLLNAGHQVTYITPFVKTTPQQNLRYVDVSATIEAVADNSTFSIELLMESKTKLDQHKIFHMMRKVSLLAFENDNVKKFLEDTREQFDVVVSEWMFNELYSGFAAVFNCPYIWMFPFEPNFVATSLIDAPTNPAYAANFELNIESPFSFVERVRNLWFQISHQFNSYFFYDALERDIYNQVFGPIQMKKHGHIVPYDSLRYNASLMLSYSHNSLGQSLSIPQNLIPVGGYHVDENPVPLPKDLQNIMDNAKEGVIYFSMGSNLKSKSFPKFIVEGLIKMFRKTQYTVLWKYEGNITGYSNNVHILNWAPQQSILAHPNCILFITHGGLLSTMEAVHHGIPIIGIPVFYDQFSNINSAVKRGFAKKVTLSKNFAKDLKAAIAEVLTDHRYSAKAKELSFVFHHRPVSPGATLVHWVEHVVATRGAPHLRSPGLLLPWYQRYYLDLLAVLIFFLVGAVYSVTLLVNIYRKYQYEFITKKVA